jgi:hypothetical protein
LEEVDCEVEKWAGPPSRPRACHYARRTPAQHIFLTIFYGVTVTVAIEVRVSSALLTAIT